MLNGHDVRRNERFIAAPEHEPIDRLTLCQLLLGDARRPTPTHVLQQYQYRGL